MVKKTGVEPLRPSPTSLLVSKSVEKDRSGCLEIKSLHSALDDVTSERQSNECKQEARRKRTQMRKVIKEELKCLTDLKLYAAYLSLESGALLEHPWIKKLIAVSNRKLDPHELLKTYRENPGSLKIADVKNANHFWMPPKDEETTPLQLMSRCEALRALVGKQNWKESPKLQAFQKQTKEKVKRVGKPSRDLRDEDDLEDFLGYICDIENS